MRGENLEPTARPLPPAVHRPRVPAAATDFVVAPLAPWSSHGPLAPGRTRSPAAEDRQPERSPFDVTEEPQPIDEFLLESADEVAGAGEYEFPFEEPAPAGSTSGEPLSPWESFGKAVQDSVSFDLPDAEEAAQPEPWAETTREAEAREPAATSSDSESMDAMTDIARRLEAFAAELERVGYAAVTRGLTRDRFEAALASLIAGYVAASRSD